MVGVVVVVCLLPRGGGPCRCCRPNGGATGAAPPPALLQRGGGRLPGVSGTRWDGAEVGAEKGGGGGPGSAAPRVPVAHGASPRCLRLRSPCESPGQPQS